MTAAPTRTRTPGSFVTPTPLAKVYVDPATQTAAPGAAASVDIRVETQKELAGYGFQIAWDPSVLALVSIVNRPFLGSTGRPVTCSFGEAVDSSSAFFSCRTSSEIPGPSGNGVLATVHFLAIAEGASPVDLVVVELVDVTITQVPLEVTDGTISVNSSTTTPLPLTATPNLTPSTLPSPVPTPVPVSGIVLHLHNNPSPPVGDTTSQAVLLMDPQAPSIATLYNYDTDRDAFPGRLVQKGGAGAAEADSTKYQAWQGAPFRGSAAIDSRPVQVVLWVALKDFAAGGPPGSMTVFLRDFNGVTYSEIALSKVSIPATGGWHMATVTFSGVDYALTPGGRLELKVIADATSRDDIWLAYDTTGYDSRLEFR